MRLVNVVRIRAAALLAAFLAVGCGSEHSGLSQGQAVTATRPVAQAASRTPVTFVSAESGRFGDFEPHVGATISAPDRSVWTVSFKGSFEGSCGGASATPHPCPAPNTSIRVVIDYVSGAFIMSQTPAQQP